MTGYWDELGKGHPSRAIDRAAWAEELARLGDPPPPGMGPQGRRSAEQAADRFRYAAFLIALALVAGGACIWSLVELR